MRDQKFSPLLVSNLTLLKAEKGLLCTLWNFEISLSLTHSSVTLLIINPNNDLLSDFIRFIYLTRTYRKKIFLQMKQTVSLDSLHFIKD